jgi:hypothetical protein
MVLQCFKRTIHDLTDLRVFLLAIHLQLTVSALRVSLSALCQKHEALAKFYAHSPALFGAPLGGEAFQHL